MNYWLAVVGSLQRVLSLDENLWWCVPQRARKGDSIFMYCPRSVSGKNQGIFALCRIKIDPTDDHSKNSLCSPYGSTFGQESRLLHVELEIVTKYQNPLTAQDIKRNRALKNAPVVRRNFQGTAFSLSEEIFKQLLVAIERKQEHNISRVPNVQR